MTSPSPIPSTPRAPTSLRVLGILSMIAAVVAIALTIVQAAIALSTMHDIGVPQPYVIAVICINVVIVFLSLLEFVAGIGPGREAVLRSQGERRRRNQEVDVAGDPLVHLHVAGNRPCGTV